MSNKLLDYVFPISVITPTPAASTAYLKQVCIVCTPKSGQEGLIGEITLCTSMAAVSALTDNTEAQQLFNAGMNRVHVLLQDDLDMSTVFADGSDEFYTLLISSDFNDDDVELTAATGTITITNYSNLSTGGEDTIAVNGVVFKAKASGASGALEFNAVTSITQTRDNLLSKIQTHPDLEGVIVADDSSTNAITITAAEAGIGGNAITLVYTDNGTSTVGATVSGATLSGGDGLDLGAFVGVTGVSSDDDEFCEAQAIIANRAAFFTDSSSKAKNMFFAFGSLLSNLSNWLNQQYIECPFDNGVDTIGDANALFDSKISFVLTDDTQYGNRLALFAAGERAIVAPYIIRNLMIDLQSAALQWISGNQPKYTLADAALLEARLQEDVINLYINVRKWISDGTIEITLVEENFVANGSINIAEPKALWRVFNELRQTL